MSKFRVGQRVRIKWSECWPDLAGEEGTITSNCVEGGRWTGLAVPDGTNVVVAPDIWGTPIGPDGSRFCPKTCQLEPATDSYDIVSWESCIWSPHRKEEAA